MACSPARRAGHNRKLGATAVSATRRSSLRGGAAIRLVWELLGHRFLVTTAVVKTTVEMQDLRHVLARARARP